MPDISTINGVDITTLASFGGVALADGQTLDGQNVALTTDAYTLLHDSTVTSNTTHKTITNILTSDYYFHDIYFSNVHPTVDGDILRFGVSSSTSSFNKSSYSAVWHSRVKEDGSWNDYAYDPDYDHHFYSQQLPLAYPVRGSSLAYQSGINADDDSGCSGIIRVKSAGTSTTYTDTWIQSQSIWMETDYLSSQAGAVISWINAKQGSYQNPHLRFSFDSGQIAYGNFKIFGLGATA